MSSVITLNAIYKHPFTCLIAGPSGCGKSTFVKNLLINQNKLIDVNFDYVIIMLGTSCEENKTLCSLQNELNNSVKIYEVKKLFSSDFKDFPSFLKI